MSLTSLFLHCKWVSGLPTAGFPLTSSTKVLPSAGDSVTDFQMAMCPFNSGTPIHGPSSQLCLSWGKVRRFRLQIERGVEDLRDSIVGSVGSEAIICSYI